MLTGGSSESPEDDELATTLETIFGGGWEKDVGTGTATGGAATNGFGEF